MRTLLQNGPAFADETSRLLDQIKPTLPVLLANLTTLGQVGVTYNPSLQQLLVLLPAYVAGVQTYGLAENNPTGLPSGEFSLTIGDPPPCTVGFLPPSQWRSPADTTTIDTPDGLYCKLPQDSPIAVRGARNYPCMGHPGKRAPTVQICDSDKPFEPLAQRQHILGPYPIDPNLIAQGVPLDDRVNPDANIYAPVEGTPLPLGSPGSAEGPSPLPTDTPPPAPAAPPPPAPAEVPPPVGDTGAPPAVPNSFDTNGSGSGPSVAVAQYNPQTGTYIGQGGHLYQQSNLAASSEPKTWKDSLPQ